jgi:hypothetical protein
VLANSQVQEIAMRMSIVLKETTALPTSRGDGIDSDERLMLFKSLRCSRVWLYPGPHLQFDPSIYPHCGKVLQVARFAKRLTHARLAVGTGISIRKLWKIERGFSMPTTEQRAVIEKYIGVKLSKEKKPYIERAI